MRLSRSTFLGVFLLLCQCSAHAISVRVVRATLFVNEVHVLTLFTRAGGSPTARCRRLGEVLASVDGAPEVRVRRSGRSYKVMVGSAAILVKRGEARAHGISTAALAESWAASLRHALSLPPLRVAPTSVILPLGASKDISIVGSEAMAARVAPSARGVVSLTRRPGVLRITACGYGKAAVVATGRSASDAIDVRVLPWAARLPQDLTVSVTGAPATIDVVRGAVERAVRTQLSTVPDAWISFTLPEGADVSPADSLHIPVRVRVGSSDSLTVSGTASVTVRNLGLENRKEAELWYSNSPESVKRPGVLYGGELRRERPVRFLFHHVNDSGRPLTADVRLVNLADEPARLIVTPGEATPDKNPVLAGAEAGDEFLRNWIFGSGEVVWLPAHAWVPLSLRRLSPGETTSGLFMLRLLEGGPARVYVSVVARDPVQEDSEEASNAPWRRMRPQRLGAADGRRPQLNAHVYPNPFMAETVHYVVGGKEGFVYVGEQPIARADGRSKLDGNFGVVYTIDAEIKNPTPTPVPVEIVFQASTGYCGGMFVVDGKFVRSPIQQPAGGYRIWKETLQPGASASCRIVTVPFAGSCYPVTLTVRTADALASTLNP
jgi:hypothetical protein